MFDEAESTPERMTSDLRLARFGAIDNAPNYASAVGCGEEQIRGRSLGTMRRQCSD